MSKRRLRPCPYCGAEVQTRNRYGRAIAECEPCDARAGLNSAHSRHTMQVANKIDRRLRQIGHTRSDLLISAHQALNQCPRNESRGKFYRWLAAELDAPPREAHFSVMVGRQLQDALTVINRWYKPLQRRKRVPAGAKRPLTQGAP